MNTRSITSLEQSRAIFATAADRANISLLRQDLDSLAHTATFASRILPTLPTKLATLCPQLWHPLSNRTAEEFATNQRRVLDLGFTEPLFDLPRIIERAYDVLVFLRPWRNLSDGCALIDGHAFIFLSEELDVALKRLLCAHHLGHLLLRASTHKADGFAVLHATRVARATKVPAEYFTDTFAVRLLVPEEGLKRAVAQIRRSLKTTGPYLGDIELLYLARIFGVPFLNIARRCERAGMLPHGAAVIFDRFLTVRFGSADQRADLLNLPVKPAVQIGNVPAPLKAATIRLIRNNRLSIEEASAALSWPASDLTRACRSTPSN